MIQDVTWRVENYEADKRVIFQSPVSTIFNSSPQSQVQDATRYPDTGEGGNCFNWRHLCRLLFLYPPSFYRSKSNMADLGEGGVEAGKNSLVGFKKIPKRRLISQIPLFYPRRYGQWEQTKLQLKHLHVSVCK